MFGKWDADRNRLLHELYELSRGRALLLYRERNRQSLMGVGLQTIYEINAETRKSPEFKRLVAREKVLKRELDHQFRREIECPLSTRGLGQKGYHVYLRIAQHEAYAARGRAFAFTLVGNFSNRENLLHELQKAGFTIEWTIGCKRIPLKANDNILLDEPTDRQESPDQKVAKRKTKKSTAKKSRSCWGRKARGEGNKNIPKKQEPKFWEMLHLHGVAIATNRVKRSPLKALKKILGEKTFVKKIAPPDPEKPVVLDVGKKRKKTGRRTAALAQGFLAYAIYMAKNYAQPCSIKHLKRSGGSRDTQKLTKLEKSKLHPNKTRGELEAWDRAKEAKRIEIGAPKTGKQWWIFQHWEEITEATKCPRYNYPAEVILRDGFKYTLKPEWDWEFQTVGVRTVACAYERDLIWQEKEADMLRLGRPLKSKAVYKSQGGECELDILLHLSRFRRVIQVNESPQCPIYSYCLVSGKVRPHRDRLLDEKVA